MVDESMDKEQLAQPPQPYEFRTKSSGQRLLIMVAGVLFNFLLALFIYSMILFTWGDNYLPLKNIKMGMNYGETFKNIGFEDGDVLLQADGKELKRLDASTIRTVINADVVTVLRQGVTHNIAVPNDMMQRVMREKSFFAEPRFPFVVDSVADSRTPAAKAGMMRGDTVVAVDGIPTPTYSDVTALTALRKGQNITLDVMRNGSLHTLTLRTDTTGMMGLYCLQPYVSTHFGFIESFPAGVQLGVHTLAGYVSDMRFVFTKEGASMLGGFGAIGSLFPSIWDWRAFWMTTAFLSIILAFMNILPIPALDGGHVLFLLYEVVTRRKPSDKFLEYAQIAGMILLFALLIYANGNDVFRFIFNR